MRRRLFIQIGMAILFGCAALPFWPRQIHASPQANSPHSDGVSDFMRLIEMRAETGHLSPAQILTVQHALERTGVLHNPVANSPNALDGPIIDAFAAIMQRISTEQYPQLLQHLRAKTQSTLTNNERRSDDGALTAEIFYDEPRFVLLQPDQIAHPVSGRPIALTEPLQVATYPVPERLWAATLNAEPKRIAAHQPPLKQLGQRQFHLDFGCPVYHVATPTGLPPPSGTEPYKFNNALDLINALNKQLPDDAEFVFDLPRKRELDYLLANGLSELATRAPDLFALDTPPSVQQVDLRTFAWFQRDGHGPTASHEKPFEVPQTNVAAHRPLKVQGHAFYNLIGLVRTHCVLDNGVEASYGIADYPTLLHARNVVDQEQQFASQHQTPYQKWFRILGSYVYAADYWGRNSEVLRGMRLVKRLKRP